MNSVEGMREPVEIDIRSHLERQLEKWRSDLMSVDKRNRLVYFKHTKSASLEVAGPSPESFMQTLGNRPRVGLTALDDDEPAPEDLALLGCPVTVRNKRPAELRRSLQRLRTVAIAEYNDKGLWTLYAGIGMLTWREAPGAEPINSPLVLVPVSLERRGKQGIHSIGPTEYETTVNPALRHKLEHDFGFELPEFWSDSEDVDDAGIAAYLDLVRRAVADRPGWSVEDRIVVARFSFYKEAIHRDIGDHRDQLFEHDLIRSMVLGVDDSDDAGSTVGDLAAIDEWAPPEPMHTVLDADSSQRRCIHAASAGQSFVIDGPPGTGKSQTIANIIAELIANGKSVLFVSEKIAALDVVRNRLSEVSLGSFLLELHSHQATRKEFIEQLKRSLETRERARHRAGDADRDDVRREREDLTAYAMGINELRPGLNRSLFDVLGDILANRPTDVRHLSADASWRDLDRERFESIVRLAGQLSNAWRPVAERETYEWRGLARPSHDDRAIQHMSAAAESAGHAAHRLSACAESFRRELRLDFDKSILAAERQRELLGLLRDRPDFVDRWLTDPSMTHLRSRVSTLSEASRRVHHQQRVVAELTSTDPGLFDPDRLAPVAELNRVGSDTQAWVGGSDARIDLVGSVHRFLGDTPGYMLKIRESGRRLGTILGLEMDHLTLDQVRRTIRLARVAEGTVKPESAWIDPTVQRALDESLRVLREVGVAVRSRRESIGQVFTEDALNADLHGLNTRFAEVHTTFWRRRSKQARMDRKLLKSLTIRRRVDPVVLARLDDAVAWQQAEMRLRKEERQYAGRLGPQYDGADTDFGRLEEAISVAHDAVQLAGASGNTEALRRQVAADGSPDPQLIEICNQVEPLLDEWVRFARSSLGSQAFADLTNLPVERVAEWATSLYDRMTPGVDAARGTQEAAGSPLTLAQAEAILGAVSDLVAAQAQLYDSFDSDRALLGSSYNAEQTDWRTLGQSMGWAEKVRDVVGSPLTPESVARMRETALSPDETDDLLSAWGKARDELASWFTMDRAVELTGKFDADLTDAALTLRRMAESCSSDVRECDRHVDITTRLSHERLAPLIAEMKDHSTPTGDVHATVRTAVLEAWVDAVVAADPRLSAYAAADRDQLVAHYREIDERLVNSAKLEVAERAAERKPRSASGSGTQLIRKEANKKSRHKPIRTVLAEAEDIVKRIKPCFMMSPLAVSQYLPEDIRFDTVIFDEASQVVPADAVNCIYRGRQLIVAGDDKQLPPTAFFQSVEEADEGDDEAPDEYESILKALKSTGLEAMRLNWHYRSRHEDLIAFSNHEFYKADGEALQTFPGAMAQAPDLGVEFFEVPDGVYRRGTTADNPIEATYVIDRVAYHREHHPGLSVGVVTFSSAQQRTVLDELERRADDERSLVGLLDSDNRLDGFFVKNIESVQGDERDIMIFSVGYGPDEHGKLTANFGALNKQNGWRRLNVAITRARRRVEVVASFKPGQIPDSDKRGVHSLRRYIDFAVHKQRALAIDDDVVHQTESPFEEDVLRLVRSWGYDAVPQVGAAGYRIDIGVRHPERAGEYMLGIECDGAAYHSAKSARDRDRLRGQVLEGLGWRLHRIWGLSWYRDRDRQAERLRSALEEACARTQPRDIDSTARLTDSVDLQDAVSVDDVDFDLAPDWAIVYEAYESSETLPGATDIRSDEARPRLRRFLLNLIDNEAPIHEQLLFDRVREAFEIGGIGSARRETIRRVVRSLRFDDGQRVLVDERGFLHIKGRQVEVVRVPDGTVNVRRVEHVPIAELALAVERLVDDAVSIEFNALEMAIKGLFGWRRGAVKITQAIEDAVEFALSEGRIECTRDGILRIPIRS